jgi:hypothetical protein
MSYPRNAASPPTIAVGVIYLLADGTIQTTGASARVKTGSGAWGAAAGTLACDATSGVWTYTPTQAETDAESFLVAIYKASSTAAQVTVATSASATAGYSGVDWGKISQATSTVDLSGTTISALSSAGVDAIVADFLAHVITKGSAGTIERAFWQAAKSQASAEGEVSGTPTASAFDTDLTAVTGAFDDLLILFVSGSLTGEARPIATYSNTDGRITLQESLTAAPSAADEFLIIPSHTHPIADIQDGLATSAALATVDGLVDLLVSRSGYQMSILAGAISNAQDAAEAYSITLDGSTYSVTYSGLDASGNRSGATLVTT